MNQKKVIIIGVALLAVVLIAVGVAAALLHGGDGYAAKLEAGYRYLDVGDFENAILMFTQAIDLDDTQMDAYYGLYQAYMRSGQQSMAVAALNSGVIATGDAGLRSLLSQLQSHQEPEIDSDLTDADQPSQGVQEEQTDTEDIDGDKGLVPVLNTELLNVFCSANYNDYLLRFGYASGSMAGEQYALHLKSIGATLIYKVTDGAEVLDPTAGTPRGELMPDEIRLDDVTTLFGSVGDVSFEELRNLNGVMYPNISGDTITFNYKDCAVTIKCDLNTMITAGSENHLVPVKRTVAPTRQQLDVSVVDATTGEPVSGSWVRIYASGDVYGTVVSEGYTDAAGVVALTVTQSGNYVAVIERDGYISDTFDVQILSGAEQTEEVFEISPVMSGEGIRLVLTWGASPSDLDSHLIGLSGDGTSFYVDFTQKHAFDRGGNEIAELDLDDTTGYGPETTTIYDTTGEFEFYIDDFTNSGTISSSGATVKIYVGDTLFDTVEIVEGVEDKWHVCTIVDGVITVTNRSM